MSRGPSGHWRGTVVVAAAAVLVLAFGSATFLTALINSQASVRNRVFGTVACTAPHLSGKAVNVTLSDAGNSMMGRGPMMVTLRATPDTVAAGQVSFVVHNTGALAHELVVLPMPPDGPGTRRTPAGGKIDEAQSLGEASKSCAAETGDGITPGSTSWTTVTLPPGRYELVCNEPWHYSAGMFDVFTVN
jgi:uncharacterized cupredoxin-like copper-binding protein